MRAFQLIRHGSAKAVFKDVEVPKLAVNSLRLAGRLTIIFIKIIIEDPFPRFSLVISSANHIESIDPVVKEKMIFNARTRFQLNTTGFIKMKATPELNIKAQPKVKYLVYRLIC